MHLSRGARTLAAAAALALALPAGAQTWNLVWSDEFNGTPGTYPDTTRWSYEVGGGGWGNGESETYCAPGSSAAPCVSTSPNAFMDGNGNLVIRARRDAAGKWTSARMVTSGKFSIQYGRIEARMKLVAASGLWPAFWMLGTNIGSVGWPSCGEIDIMEWVDNYGPSVTSSAIHGPGYSGGGNIGVSTGFPNGTRIDDPGYHVYGVIWSANLIQFYRDTPANVTRTITPANLPAGTTWAYNHPFYVLLNQAVGGNWFPGPDATTPAVNDVLVDYLRVYQSSSTPPPASGVVALRASANSQYVCAESAGANPLVANRAAASTWEQFRVLNNSDGTLSLQAVINNRYVTADTANGGRLVASATAIGTAQKFTRVNQANGTVALRSLANDQYVCADLNQGSVLYANRAAASTWEQFTLVPQ